MLKVEHLNKEYPLFKLSDVSFHLPKGYIMGFIGMNGAGKTTTIKSILNLVKSDSGKVTILGKDMANYELEIKQEIGFMSGSVDYYPKTKIKKLVNVYKKFYKEWDEKKFQELLKRFFIVEDKRISELSSGMRTKLGIAMALSHNAKLIILDEPTSGLDPIARNDLLDFFHEIVSDGEKSILFSTHITSDLDKCADYIVLIKNGKIVINDTKDNIIDSHIIVKGKQNDLNDDLRARFIGYKKNQYGFSALALKAKITDNDCVQTEIPTLEDLVVYYNKEEV